MVRDARIDELGRVNEIRREVNRLHAEGRPDIFQPVFSEEMEKVPLGYLERDDRRALVAERDGEIAGIAMIEYVRREPSPYVRARNYLHITEFGVGAQFQRQGAGRELYEYIRSDAKARGYASVELDAWSFNEGALDFYKTVGMTPFRVFFEEKI